LGVISFEYYSIGNIESIWRENVGTCMKGKFNDLLFPRATASRDNSAIKAIPVVISRSLELLAKPVKRDMLFVDVSTYTHNNE
jgi:hypothetical protein